MKRRQLLAALTAASLGRLAVASTGAPRLEAYPFQLGVASGSPTDSSVVLWTRALPLNPLNNPWATQTLELRWELATDPGFTQLLRQGSVQALPMLAHSVHVEPQGLPPDTVLYYRFMLGDAVSPAGRTRTLPAPDQPKDRLRLAFASCQRLGVGLFGAYTRLLEEDVDLIAFVGDYIYESGAYPSAALPQGLAPASDLAGYRLHYETHKREPTLQAAHAAVPWLLTWDDHEVMNDYAGGPLVGVGSRDARRRASAYQAYYEHMPLPLASLQRGLLGLTEQGEELRLYGHRAWGRLASLHLLDCRQYRSPHACRGLASLIDPDDCKALRSPEHSLLGAAQAQWLHGSLGQQARTWNLILQTTMVAPRRIPFGGGHRIWADGWDGYPQDRERLLEVLRAQQIGGAVFLGGDLHENWANDLQTAEGHAVATEFVGAGITMKSFFPSRTPGILAANPLSRYASGKDCGYALLELTPQQLRCDFRVVDSLATNEPGIRTAASFVVTPQSPRLLGA
ncbi:alkaline phosphatase D family protein [Roseateles sp.]|uniref:alkaline phosphatase D family protein n=1 Tax=Roseateles sp. TaxID=1971397 RepID=UPI00393B707D